jgi:alpha-beta hydrolase superfamily lysophospholipase
MARKRRQELSVQSADGTSIGYTLSGAGPCILLVHGAAVDRRSCLLLGTVLADSRQVAAMDRRGRGLSPDGNREYSLTRETEDVLAVLEALPPPVHAVGISFGSLPVLEAAARSDRLAAVTLFEPPIRTPAHAFIPAARMEDMERMVAESRFADAVDVALREGVAASEDELREVAAVPGASAALEALMPVTVREFHEVGRYVPQQAMLAAIRVPVTVLVGSTSHAQFRAAADLLAAKDPAIRTRVLPGLSHLASLMAPAPLAEAILASEPAST